MKKIFKYMMQQKAAVCIIFIFLIIQAYCDLALPSYTSDIVDVGISKGGISEVLPECIREEQYTALQAFVFGDNLELMKDSYKKVDYDKLSGKKKKSYEDKYPEIKEQAVYKLTADEDGIKALKVPLIEAEMMVAALQEKKQDVSQMTMLPEAQRQEMMKQISDKIGGMTDTVLDAMATTFVKNEYEALGMDLGKIQNHYILIAGAKMIGLSLLMVVVSICAGYFASRTAAKVGRNLRSSVFKKVVSFSGEEMDHFSTASLITRSTNDIQQLQMVMVMLLRMVLYAPILGVGGILKVLNTNTSMAWIIAVAVGAILVVVGSLFCVAMPKFKMMQTLVDRLNLVTREILTGIPVIRAFSTEKFEEKRFERANKDLTKTMLFTNRTMTVMMPAMMLIVNCVSLAIVWFGGKKVDLGTLQVGDMIAFITYAIQIVLSFLMLTMISIMLPRAGVSANRIDEVLTTKVRLTDPENPKDVSETGSRKGTVTFEKVFFKYPDADGYTLENISFTAKPGQTTAFIGSTGSGKSTLVNLIPRFYDVTKGSVKIDGIDVKDMAQKSLRDRLGFVPQKAVLFSGTIESNLKYGKEDISDAAMEKSAEIAQAAEFIASKEEKYESPIAQGGNNVSGGQKQRLSIARAIAKNPEIFIFDDSFSALDFKTDAALRSALHKEISESTVLIVAQRISTILHADQIIVMDEGKIVGMGTHEELLKNCKVYYQIASSQLSAKELEQYGVKADV